MAQKKTKKANPKPAKRRIKRADPLEQLAPDDRQALVFIGTRPGCGLKAICQVAGCTTGAGTSTIKKLSKLGLVRRDESKRPYRHYCTTQGYKLRERVCAEA
jgi:DNA-binding MarR family transcriptional regulator